MAKKHTKITKRFNRQKFIPLFSTFIGILLITGFIAWNIYQNVLVYTIALPETQQVIHNASTVAPKKLVINAAGAGVPITESVISNGRWGVSKTSISHLITSANPGENEVIILYGHNKDSLLKPLTKVQKGDLLTIQDIKNKNHQYKITSIATVSPSDTYVLDSDGKEKLIVYTCTGIFDTKRLIVTALPI